jgi:hypothetical protein
MQRRSAGGCYRAAAPRPPLPGRRRRRGPEPLGPGPGPAAALRAQPLAGQPPVVPGRPGRGPAAARRGRPVRVIVGVRDRAGRRPAARGAATGGLSADRQVATTGVAFTGPVLRPTKIASTPTTTPRWPRELRRLFDATEIDEILTLRTMALTEGEKREARHRRARRRDHRPGRHHPARAARTAPRRGPPAAAGERPGPAAAAGAIAARLEAPSPSPAVPPTCPKHRSAAVIHGQPWSVPVPSTLKDQPLKSGRRVLPKLAVRVRFPSPALTRTAGQRLPAG